MHRKISFTISIFSFVLSVILHAQTNDELIDKLKILTNRLDKYHSNIEWGDKSEIVVNNVFQIKHQISYTKNNLISFSNDLDNPVYYDNNVYLDYNVDLIDFYVYEYSDSYYEVHARIKNKQRKYLEWVKLRYSFYSKGLFVGTDYTYIDFESYGYSGISPYNYSFIETYIDKIDFDSIAYQVEYDVESGQDYILWDQILILQAVVIQPTGDYNKWQGVVENNFNYSMRFPNIFACIFKDDKMVCTDFTYLDVQNDSLPANSEGVFDSYIDLPSDYDEVRYFLKYALYSLDGSGNLPPNRPIFTENSYSGSSRASMPFDIFVIDPEGDSSELLLDYNDGLTMLWEGSYISGYNARITHAYATSGHFIMHAKSRDYSGFETDWSESINVNIIQSTVPQIIQDVLDPAIYDIYYSKQINASNGILPYTWEVSSGSFPDGLSFNSSRGLISGLPSRSGNFEFTITVSDAGTPSLSNDGVFNLHVINHCPELTSDDTVSTFTNTHITYVASAVDSDGNPITFNFIDYPDWLSATNLTLHGTSPNTPVDTSFSVIASDGELSDTLNVTLIVNEQTFVFSQDDIPKLYSLSPNFPNPFNSQTSIKIDLPKETDLTICIYNSTGSIIEKIFKGQLSPGYYNFLWEATNQPSGTYLIKVQSKDFTKVTKCLLIR